MPGSVKYRAYDRAGTRRVLVAPIRGGGGVMLDFCCYGAMVSKWYIGQQATAAIGFKANLDSQWGDAEDNAAIIVRFPQAMALLEGSWTTYDHGVSGGPIVLGATGTLVMGASEKVRLGRGNGHDEEFDCPPLPKGREDVAGRTVPSPGNG